jgi:hypothetical protein
MDTIVQALRTDGYYVVPNLFSAAECAMLCSDFEDMLRRYADRVQNKIDEGTFNDYRLFGVEAESQLIDQRFHRSGFLTEIGRRFTGIENLVNHFVMGNRVMYDPNHVSNSGGGWHRDNYRNVYKALVYLTDVGPQNGPFTIIRSSTRSKIPPREPNTLRYSDETVDGLLQQAGRRWWRKERLVELTGPAGTCIVFDRSCVHRGKNIEAGQRVALTNYYFPDTPERWQRSQERWGKHLLRPLIGEAQRALQG